MSDVCVPSQTVNCVANVVNSPSEYNLADLSVAHAFICSATCLKVKSAALVTVNSVSSHDVTGLGRLSRVHE